MSVESLLPAALGDGFASTLAELTPCPLWIHDASTLELLHFNRAAGLTLGLEYESLGSSAACLFPEGEDVPLLAATNAPARLVTGSGELLDAWLSVRPLALSGHNVCLVVADNRVERSRAAEALAAAEARYRSIFDYAIEGIFQTSPDGKYLDANPALARIYGYASPAELTRHVTDISRQLYVDPSRRDTFVRLMRERGLVESFESQIVRKDGAIVWISECVRAVHDPAGNLLYYEGTVVDITLRKVAEDRLRHEASHDKLTGFPNRSAFMQQTAEALEETDSEGGCAVLFIDFDRFKLINDSLGHLAGDQFLRAAAKRLAQSLRPNDLVARLGGDEFGILLRGVYSRGTATYVADRIQGLLQEPFEIGGRRLFVSASVGIALGDETYSHPEDLLRDADIAMYRAKDAGRARQVLFDAAMREHALARLQLETDLRLATERGELTLHYQPLVDLQTGETTAFEALIRWNHPHRGLLYPDAVIPAAEDTGAIMDIGAWVVQAACHQACEWETAHGVTAPISINISSQQFLQPDFSAWVGQILDTSGLSGDRLKVEITESVLMGDPEGVLRLLLGLRERGVRICLDDFGTGFSSLSYLQRFPFDEIKIDRSFIASIGTESRNSAILEAIIALARNLGLDAVAEGVETEVQAAELRRLGCPLAQGHLFSRPVPAEVACRRLRGSGSAC
jgi:diguanylate cyclase (GGDEF)-like protein/PAS domain S-box-containing protein